MSNSSLVRAAARWCVPATVLACAALHVAILLPSALRAYPSDDTLLLVPAFLAGLEGRSGWTVLTYLFSVDQWLLPPAPWKLYVLASLWLFGPWHGGLVLLGIAAHAMCSGLVWALSRQLGLPPTARWLAAGLHFTAYPGFHAYLWPVSVQHVLTTLGILGVFTLYLATEHRRRAGLPCRALYWATIPGCAVCSRRKESDTEPSLATAP